MNKKNDRPWWLNEIKSYIFISLRKQKNITMSYRNIEIWEFFKSWHGLSISNRQKCGIGAERYKV